MYTEIGWESDHEVDDDRDRNVSWNGKQYSETTTSLIVAPGLS